MNLTEDPRAALEIPRYHTWSVLHHQSVGEHVAQLLRILLTVWPRAPWELQVHTVTHDMGEMAGDIPFPFKKRYPELASGAAKAELDVIQTMADRLGMPPMVQLTDTQHRIFKLIEYIEMWEYSLREINLGNRYAELIRDRTWAEIQNSLDGLHALGPDYAELLTNIRNYIKTRQGMEQ